MEFERLEKACEDLETRNVELLRELFKGSTGTDMNRLLSTQGYRDYSLKVFDESHPVAEDDRDDEEDDSEDSFSDPEMMASSIGSLGDQSDLNGLTEAMDMLPAPSQLRRTPVASKPASLSGRSFATSTTAGVGQRPSVSPSRRSERTLGARRSSGSGAKSPLLEDTSGPLISENLTIFHKVALASQGHRPSLACDVVTPKRSVSRSVTALPSVPGVPEPGAVYAKMQQRSSLSLGSPVDLARSSPASLAQTRAVGRQGSRGVSAGGLPSLTATGPGLRSPRRSKQRL